MGGPGVVLTVGGCISCGVDPSGVVKIVDPQRVCPHSSRFGRSDQLRVLGFALRDHDNFPGVRCKPCAVNDVGDNVAGRRVSNVLGSVQSETIKPVVSDPHFGVLNKKLSNWAVLSLEVDALTPVIFIFVGKKFGRKLTEIVSVWSKVIVGNIEKHGDSVTVRLINQRPKVIRRSINSRR